MQGTEQAVGKIVRPADAVIDSVLARARRAPLSEAGFVEGQNVTVDYRWAEEHYDRLPAMATDLVNRHVATIVATSTPAALAAKAATTAVPIILKRPQTRSNLVSSPALIGPVATSLA